jgi:hypothetical protein
MGDWYDMTADQVLSYVKKRGILLSPHGNRIKYEAPIGVMTPDLVELIKNHKQGILGILNSDRRIKNISPYVCAEGDQHISPGDCDSCPAAGYWDFKGPGMWCFYSGYFLGKPAKPVRCITARQDCPLQNRA